MKIHVLGHGMLGSKVIQVMNENGHEVTSINSHCWNELFDSCEDKDVVINCIGIVKQRDATTAEMIQINSLFPHLLEQYCNRLIHISTDCVFDGKKGNYSEADNPTPIDIYGRSKLLGELPNSLTLRTSIIGHGPEYGLLEWFLKQNGRAIGFTNAVFSGFPTIRFAKIIKQIVNHHSDLRGVFHCSSHAIDKFSLLCRIAEVYEKDIIIDAQSHPYINRSLDSTRLRKRIGNFAPSWDDMIVEMYRDHSGSV